MKYILSIYLNCLISAWLSNWRLPVDSSQKKCRIQILNYLSGVRLVLPVAIWNYYRCLLLLPTNQSIDLQRVQNKGLTWEIAFCQKRERKLADLCQICLKPWSTAEGKFPPLIIMVSLIIVIWTSQGCDKFLFNAFSNAKPENIPYSTYIYKRISRKARFNCAARPWESKESSVVGRGVGGSWMYFLVTVFVFLRVFLYLDNWHH